ncbi:MAG: hypothetical protein OEZ65_00105 [Gemmatimonadota bacterium]|nr:hypothetical protein [Gemmatimonadota bacterium]MDH5757954.1 hypothetical protein [Gemmatimonadota bacterium]
MKSAILACSMVLGLLVVPVRASAQDSSSISLSPRIALFAPDSYFYEDFVNFAGDGPVEWSHGALGRMGAFGVSGEWRVAHGIRIRGEILRSFDGWLRVAHSVVTPRVLFEPPRVVTTWLDAPATLTLTSLQVVLPTELRWEWLRPYVSGGVGGKRYAFGDPLTPNEAGATLPSPGFTWGGDLGAGVELTLLGITADLQVRDAITRYWGKTQHDLVYTGGLWFNVR